MTETHTPAPPRRSLDDLTAAIDVMHWSRNDIGRIFGVDQRLARRWFAGAVECPHNVADWLVRCADFMRANPPPTRFEYDDEPAAGDEGNE